MSDKPTDFVAEAPEEVAAATDATYEDLVDPDIRLREKVLDEERVAAVETRATAVAELAVLGLSEETIAFLTRE